MARRLEAGVKAAALLLALLAVFGAGPPRPATGAGVPVLRGAAGWIVFDSSRAGSFDVWKVKPDGSSPVRLTSEPGWEIYPDWSPDGKRIVFARHPVGETRGGGEVWLMDADGGGARRVARQGTFPQFTPDGTGVIFERRRRQVVRLDLESGREEGLFPPPGGHWRWEVVKPRLSPDGRTLLFITDKGGKWHLYAFAPGRDAFEVADGCEGDWSPDGRRVFFIHGGELRGTAIWSLSWPGGDPGEYLEPEGRYDHPYFPSVSGDGRWLLYSACPSGQHDHFSANYQIFIKPVEGGRPARLAENAHTDRWPRWNPSAR